MHNFVQFFIDKPELPFYTLKIKKTCLFQSFQFEAAMTNPLIQQKALETLVLVNTAITNLRLYPPTSAMITNTTGRLYQALLDIFEETDSINFAETEKNMLINGELLSGRDLERPPVKAFLNLLLSFGIRSVSIKKGIEKQEVTDFLQVIGKRQEVIQSEGGLEKLMADIKAPHILLDRTIYVATDRDHQILASLEIKDDDIIQYMVGSSPDITLDYQRLKELARQPEWIAEIFQKGMMQLRQQREFLSNIKVSDNLVRMIGIIEKIMGNMDQDKLSQLIGRAFAELDPEMISLVLSHDIDDLFGGRLFDKILAEMDEDKFAAVVQKLQAMEKNNSAKALDYVSGGKEALERTRSRLLASDRGIRHQQKMQEDRALKKQKIEKQLQEMKEKMAPSPDGEANGPADSQFIDSLMDMTDDLAACGEHEYIETLIRQATEGLLSYQQYLRDRASAVLAQIIDRLPEDQQALLLDTLMDTLAQWIKIETSATMAYKKICDMLNVRIAERIAQKQFAGCIAVLDVFHLIDSGILEKNDTIQAIASDVVKVLASPERLEILLEAFGKGDEETRTSAGRVLARLGNIPLNFLLDLLRDQKDSQERVRILHLLTEIGQPTIPIIRQRLNYNEPWYFLRNLVYILGRIDNEASAELLGDFLLHKDEKVRQEALKSLQRIGGNRKGQILLAVLQMADESFQKDIVEELGNLRYAGAVPVLLDLLSTRPLLISSSRTDLEEKICFALGRIGSQEAAPVLAEVSRSKGFFSKKSYSDKVKIAAARALFLIKSNSPS
jgi:HEAT repeat protein